MRCAEAQEPIRLGRSTYIDGCRPDACVYEVDGHVDECGECREEVIRERWRRWRRWPSPFGLLRTMSTVQHFKRSPITFGFADERPITRIVNSVIVIAIKERADAIESTKYPPSSGSMAATEPAWPYSEGGEMLGHLRAAVAEAHSQVHPTETARALKGAFRSRGVWYETMMLPPYVAEAVKARIKSLSELLVCACPMEQHGKIPIQYEDRDYDVDVHIEPHDGDERIIMELRRSESTHPDSQGDSTKSS